MSQVGVLFGYGLRLSRARRGDRVRAACRTIGLHHSTGGSDIPADDNAVR